METNEDIKSIKCSLRNERMAPEILPFNVEAFEDLKACLDYQTEIVEQKEIEKFQMYLFELEIERVRFYLAEYLRTRLKKIQKYASYILKTPEIRSRLSAQEVQFAVGYVETLKKCFEKTAMCMIPARYKDVISSNPNLFKAVVAKALVDIGTLQISESGQTLEISKGDVYVLKYIYIRSLLRENKVCLL